MSSPLPPLNPFSTLLVIPTLSDIDALLVIADALTATVASDGSAHSILPLDFQYILLCFLTS